MWICKLIGHQFKLDSKSDNYSIYQCRMCDMLKYVNNDKTIKIRNIKSIIQLIKSWFKKLMCKWLGHSLLCTALSARGIGSIKDVEGKLIIQNFEVIGFEMVNLVSNTYTCKRCGETLNQHEIFLKKNNLNMHRIRLEKVFTKDNAMETFTTVYESMIIVHQRDIDNKLVCLRGYSVDLLIIPREYRNKLHKDKNKELNYLLNLSLRKNGKIKFY